MTRRPAPPPRWPGPGFPRAGWLATALVLALYAGVFGAALWQVIAVVIDLGAERLGAALRHLVEVNFGAAPW